MKLNKKLFSSIEFGVGLFMCIMLAVALVEAYGMKGILLTIPTGVYIGLGGKYIKDRLEESDL